jgi:predicted nucleic acid-binding protein
VTGLADASLLIWLGRREASPEAEEVRAQIAASRIAICEPVMLEMLRGASDASMHAEMADELLGFPQAAISQGTFARARAIQERLAALPGPRHRSVALADLLVAAAAIDAELPVLHRDRDFEAIAAVTGQAQTWVGPPA